MNELAIRNQSKDSVTVIIRHNGSNKKQTIIEINGDNIKINSCLIFESAFIDDSNGEAEIEIGRDLV